MRLFLVDNMVKVLWKLKLKQDFSFRLSKLPEWGRKRPLLYITEMQLLGIIKKPILNLIKRKQNRLITVVAVLTIKHFAKPLTFFAK